MPRIRWDERSLGWFSDFSRYTGFHEKLAGLLRPELTGCQTLCDAGCGAGFVDLYLAGSVESLTCVDWSEAAVAYLRRTCALRGINNLTAVAADCESLSGSWDAVLFSFFGTNLLERFLPRCRKLLMVMGDEDTHGLLPGKRPRRQSADGLEALLREREIPYSVQKSTLEAGQPFGSLEEAVRFLRYYADCPEREAEEFLAARLVPAGEDEFAYYLPRRKPVAVFAIAGSACDQAAGGALL
jgi:SAM-dependent methyltransferase